MNLSARGPTRILDVTYEADKGDGPHAYKHDFRGRPRATIRGGRMSFPVTVKPDRGRNQETTGWLFNPRRRSRKRVRSASRNPHFAWRQSGRDKWRIIKGKVKIESEKLGYPFLVEPWIRGRKLPSVLASEAFVEESPGATFLGGGMPPKRNPWVAAGDAPGRFIREVAIEPAESGGVMVLTDARGNPVRFPGRFPGELVRIPFKTAEGKTHLILARVLGDAGLERGTNRKLYRVATVETMSGSRTPTPGTMLVRRDSELLHQSVRGNPWEVSAPGVRTVSRPTSGQAIAEVQRLAKSGKRASVRFRGLGANPPRHISGPVFGSVAAPDPKMPKEYAVVLYDKGMPIEAFRGFSTLGQASRFWDKESKGGVGHAQSMTVEKITPKGWTKVKADPYANPRRVSRRPSPAQLRARRAFVKMVRARAKARKRVNRKSTHKRKRIHLRVRPNPPHRGGGHMARRRRSRRRVSHRKHRARTHRKNRSSRKRSRRVSRRTHRARRRSHGSRRRRSSRRRVSRRHNMGAIMNPRRRRRVHRRRRGFRLNPLKGGMGKIVKMAVAAGVGFGVYYATKWAIGKIGALAKLSPMWHGVIIAGVGAALGFGVYTYFKSRTLGLVAAAIPVALGLYHAWQNRKALPAPSGAAAASSDAAAAASTKGIGDFVTSEEAMHLADGTRLEDPTTGEQFVVGDPAHMVGANYVGDGVGISTPLAMVGGTFGSVGISTPLAVV